MSRSATPPASPAQQFSQRGEGAHQRPRPGAALQPAAPHTLPHRPAAAPVVVPIHQLGTHSRQPATQSGRVAELYYSEGEPLASGVVSTAVKMAGMVSFCALGWVLFGRVGLALSLIYAAGFLADQVAKALAIFIKIPPLSLMLAAGLILRNVPGPWRDLMQEVPSEWFGALRTVATAVIILRAGMYIDLAGVRANWFGIVCLAQFHAPGVV
ncbi:hypothetical protein T484DRAFT_1789124 [Baffinella frigidus]|nr:hypothetical protein T484DRAFT_1789124 [Cryptophyta sp. CCMP2293]